MLLLQALPTSIGVAAIAPALLVLWLVIAADERPGPPTRVWLAFILGAASISLLGIARAPFAAILAVPGNPWMTQGLRSVFGVAAPEEIVKVLVIICGVGAAAHVCGPDGYRGLWRGRGPRLRGLRKPRLSRAALRHVAFAGRLAQRADGAVSWCARHYRRRLYRDRARGTALGAHRHHRDWARISSWCLALFAPVALHAAFDFPLLTLQKHPDLGPTTRMLLGAASLLIGFSSIGFAIRLVRRVGRHHAPRTEIARERLSQLRRMWALLLVGSGAGFAGAAFVLTSLHHWFVNPERNASLLLIPLGLTSILIGLALLLATSAVYVFGRNRIRTSSEGFSSAPEPRLNVILPSLISLKKACEQILPAGGARAYIGHSIGAAGIGSFQ